MMLDFTLGEQRLQGKMEIKFTNKYDINDILLMNTPLITGILTGVAVLARISHHV